MVSPFCESSFFYGVLLAYGLVAAFIGGYYAAITTTGSMWT